MKLNILWPGLAFLAVCAPVICYAQEVPRIEIEIDKTTIKANTELPKLLYIVPWKDTNLADSAGERKIIIHNLFGEFYEPIMPTALSEALQETDREGTFEDNGD